MYEILAEALLLLGMMVLIPIAALWMKHDYRRYQDSKNLDLEALDKALEGSNRSKKVQDLISEHDTNETYHKSWYLRGAIFLAFVVSMTVLVMVDLITKIIT
jgi:hypothetical protein